MRSDYPADPLTKGVRLLSETDAGLLIEGVAVPFGSRGEPDLHGEYFDGATDLAEDWFPAEGRPVLYHHGLDEDIGPVVVGRQISRAVSRLGHVVKVLLDRRSRFYEQLKALLLAGRLAFSSGAIPHLVRKATDGRLVRWPWVELSLTLSPVDARATIYPVKASDAIRHLVAAKAAIPGALRAAAVELDSIPMEMTFAAHGDHVLFALRGLRQRLVSESTGLDRRHLARLHDGLTVQVSQLQGLLLATKDDRVDLVALREQFLQEEGARIH